MCRFFCCFGQYSDEENQELLVRQGSAENLITTQYGSSGQVNLYFSSYKNEDDDACVALSNGDIKKDTIFGWKLHVSIAPNEASGKGDGDRVF
ncbi:MAG: hypothetical protein CMF39_03670 [Legionellaceae bacterium]|nr:hypothetical protein [Legionellaceae bacterium]|tara:strand:+ start:463 stop:741 length:279 start_codon:yes stop_codon:yes gene_type:complete